MTETSVSLLDRRRIEAETLFAVYSELLQTRSERAALETIAHTVSAMAFAKGRAFASQAPDKPSLEHFATIVDVWNGVGALQIEDVRRLPDSLAFSVKRCAYAELYREMELPQALIPILSCQRDAPFARGYSPRLQFSREQTIAEGGEFCDFLFEWK